MITIRPIVTKTLCGCLILFCGGVAVLWLQERTLTTITPTSTSACSCSPGTSTEADKTAAAASEEEESKLMEETLSFSKNSPPISIHRWWTPTTEPVMPLVEAGDDGEVNYRTGEPIYYLPTTKGYSFPGNGQGGKLNNHVYGPEKLKFQLHPDHVVTKQEAFHCLLQPNLEWIHIDGDSLARDIFYDIQEVLGTSWNSKKKTLNDNVFQYQHHHDHDEGEDAARTNATINVNSTAPITTITFSADTIKPANQNQPNWHRMKQDRKRNEIPFSQRNCPDVWIYSSGLWDHPEHTTLDHYRTRTQALADSFEQYAGKGCEIPHKILRYTTPYQLRKRLSWNDNTRLWNAIARDLLVPKGFRHVDTFEILESRGDISHDGIHYTGPGSKWITNAFFNMFC